MTREEILERNNEFRKQRVEEEREGKIKNYNQLRYFALCAMELRNALRAFDGSGIPQSDARDAYKLLREITEMTLTEKERSFGSSHLAEIVKLKKKLCPAPPEKGESS